MTKSIIAFFSLGMTCGPEVGRYGRFDVELTLDEDARIEEVIRDHKPGYIRSTLKERYPELHQKIVDASATSPSIACTRQVHSSILWTRRMKMSSGMHLLKHR